MNKLTLEQAVTKCEKADVPIYAEKETRICTLYKTQTYRYGVFCSNLFLLNDISYCTKGLDNLKALFKEYK